MIEFIIYEDDFLYQKKVKDIIDKLMFKTDTAYHIITFNKFDEKIEKIINDNNIKIYILDLDCKEHNTIEIAKKIRQKDFQSVILFITNCYDYWMYNVLQNHLLILDYIDKNHLHELSKSINFYLKKYNRNILRFKSNSVIYNFQPNDILYIEKQNRHSKIVTDNGEFLLNKTLSSIKELLDERFFYSHRSCLVNTERIVTINIKDRKIIFDNNVEINLLSFRSTKLIQKKLPNIL